MLTDEELEYAAQVAEQYPPGHGHAWFWRVPLGFFLDPEDDVKEAEEVLWLHPTWDEYGGPCVRLACLRCRQWGWKVTWESLWEAWNDLEAVLPGEYTPLLEKDPKELARRLRAKSGRKEDSQ